MDTILGSKSSFAVQIDIIRPFPTWGRFCLWLCGKRLGDYESEDYLHSYINALKQLALDFDDFWDDELNGLNYKEIFFKINPFYNNPEAFYDLSYEEQGEYVKYDKYILSWGSNFNECSPNAIIHDGICSFIWVESLLDESGHIPFGNEIDIKHCDVTLKEIQSTYACICDMIPQANYPRLNPDIAPR